MAVLSGKNFIGKIVDVNFRHIDPENMFSVDIGLDGNLGGKTNGNIIKTEVNNMVGFDTVFTISLNEPISFISSKKTPFFISILLLFSFV